MIHGLRTRAGALFALVLVIGTAILAGCASAAAPGGTPPENGGDPARPLLTTRHAATVIESGDGGVQMCIGPIAMSYPPQCGGPALVGWDWAEWSGAYAESGGVRWGEFALTGTFDSEALTFTPETIEPWRDDRTVADDRSRVPTAGAGATPEQQLAESASSPELTIINVRVVGDLEAGTIELRRIWGGMLCVSGATRTQSELQEIADDIVAETPQGILSITADGMVGRVNVEVIHDDGTLQHDVDAEYGTGVVVVTSSLRPASSE